MCMRNEKRGLFLISLPRPTVLCTCRERNCTLPRTLLPRSMGSKGSPLIIMYGSDDNGTIGVYGDTLYKVTVDRYGIRLLRDKRSIIQYPGNDVFLASSIPK